MIMKIGKMAEEIGLVTPTPELMWQDCREGAVVTLAMNSKHG